MCSVKCTFYDSERWELGSERNQPYCVGQSALFSFLWLCFAPPPSPPSLYIPCIVVDTLVLVFFALQQTAMNECNSSSCSLLSLVCTLLRSHFCVAFAPGHVSSGRYKQGVTWVTRARGMPVRGSRRCPSGPIVG